MAARLRPLPPTHFLSTAAWESLMCQGRPVIGRSHTGLICMELRRASWAAAAKGIQKEQVKFRDVAAYFSEEEWKALQEWQKDFYKIVMKEIHQALILLGYQIINADTLLRVYKRKETYSQNSLDTNRINLHNPIVSPHPAVYPDVLFRVAPEEESFCRKQQSSEEMGIRNSSGSCFPLVTTAFSLRTKHEQELDPVERRVSERRKIIDHTPTGIPFYQNDICLSKVDEPTVSLHHAAEGKGYTDHSSGSMDVVEVVEVKIKEEEIDLTNHQDADIVASFGNPTGDKSINTRKVVEDSSESSKTATYKHFLEKSKNQVHRSLQRAVNSSCQFQSESYMDMRGERTTECELGLRNSEYFSVHRGRAKVRISQKPKDCERNAINSQYLNDRLNTKHNWTSYTCNECGKQYSLKSEFTRHMETHSGVRGYAATNCAKGAFQNIQLNGHDTNTPEKPYMCSFCRKCFNRKDYLYGHIRTHTGERPHKCTECERTFTWKSHLNRHRKKMH